MQSVDVQNDGSEVDAEGWVYRLVDSIAVDHVVSEELVAPPENDAVSYNNFPDILLPDCCSLKQSCLSLKV